MATQDDVQDEGLENEGELENENEGEGEGEGEGEELEEGSEEGDEGEGGEEPARAERPRSRATERVRRSVEEARTERLRADDLERQLYQLRGELQGYQSQRDQRAEAEAYSQMSPEERVDYSLRQARQEQQQFMQHQQFATQDNADQVSFRALCRDIPEYEKLAPQVEHELSVIRRQYGLNAPRQLVLFTLIGMQAHNARMAVSQQRQQGKARIAKQTTRMSGGASDQPRRRGPPPANSPEARRKRLESAVF